jgi:biotin/methionine sulfoxide reductase
LISNQPKTKLHSQIDHGSHSRSDKIEDREPVHMNPQDAANRDLKEGDIVRMFNDRGACLGGVRIDTNLRQGVVQMSTGAWYDPATTEAADGICKHGNPNVLTPDKGTSQLGQGPIAHSCLVQIECYNAPLPPLTAFDPPEILRLKIPTVAYSTSSLSKE